MEDKEPGVCRRGKTKVPLPSREELENLYNVQDFNRRELSEFFGVGITTIGRWLEALGITKAPDSIVRKKHKIAYEDKISKEKAEDLYVVQNLSMKEMAKVLGISVSAVFRLLQYYNIKKDKTIIKENTERTNLKKYGVINPFMSRYFQEKANNTRIVRTGYAHPKYANKPQWVVDLMTNSEKFREYVVRRGYTDTLQIAKDLNIDRTTAAKIVGRSNCWDLIDMSRSSYEKEVETFLEFLKIKNFHTRQVISPYEIDLYCPEYKTGIEFNGDYWHSSGFHDSKYHYRKSVLAQEQGVFLYHIFEYEWADESKQQKIKNQLRNLFGKNETKIYARMCEIKKVPTKEKNIFLNQNHIQGVDRCCCAYGLYYRGKLVSIMTFCRPRFNRNYNWELSRFCSLANLTVVGGVSKLWKYFLNTSSGSVISYSDIAKNRGEIYKILGFKHLKTSPPNYVWVNRSGNIKYRYQTQAKNESQIMQEKGYWRIYNCGNEVWIYER